MSMTELIERIRTDLKEKEETSDQNMIDVQTIYDVCAWVLFKQYGNNAKVDMEAVTRIDKIIYIYRLNIKHTDDLFRLLDRIQSVVSYEEDIV